MAERCLTMGCPEAVRVALQDPCSGAATPGECNGYVLSCIRNWSIAPIVREGDSSEFVSDCGSMVVRSRQDDQLLGYTISFETAIRSNELEALVTGKDVIDSGGLSIGTYGVGSALSCSNPSPDPRFFLEAFYKLSHCVSGANHVRVLLPMAQFKITEIDKEGTISFFRYTAETGISLASAIGDGPYLDLPADVSTFLAARDAGEYTTGFDFEENITISGSCGCIEVPSAELLPIVTDVTHDCETGLTTIIGENLDLVGGWFELGSPCGVRRTYISTSTYPAGVLASSESPTAVTFDPEAESQCDCEFSSVLIYNGVGDQIGDGLVVDPAVQFCCPAVVFGDGVCQPGDNFIVDAQSLATGNITLNGTFPDFATFSDITLIWTSGPNTAYYPADPEITTLNATTIVIDDVLNSGKVLAAVLITDGVTTLVDCTIDPNIDVLV